MAAIPNFPGFDGLMALSRHEGVDIRPTLLRVLTDLYVQTPIHTADEEMQYIALASRLIDEVDDATRMAVRGRLSLYPRTPFVIARQLGIVPDEERIAPPIEMALATAPVAQPSLAGNATDATIQDEITTNDFESGALEADDIPDTPPAVSMQPAHAAQLSEMFFAADATKRRLILRNLGHVPAQRGTRLTTQRLDRAAENLDQAAFVGDDATFATELADALMLPSRLAERIVQDDGGEALACAAKVLRLPQRVYERILLFLDAGHGASIAHVYRLAHLYETLDSHAASVMLAAMRGASFAVTRAKYLPALHEDERQRARPTSLLRPALRHGASTPKTGNGATISKTATGH